MVQDLLELRGGGGALAARQVGFAANVRRIHARYSRFRRPTRTGLRPEEARLPKQESLRLIASWPRIVGSQTD